MSASFKTQPGDIFLVRSNEWIGKWVRLLISIRYGIPYKKAYSHIESSFDSTMNISAEPDGVKMAKNDRFDKHIEYCVYRLKKMDEQKQTQHQNIAKRFLGKRYAYARYLLDFVRIASLFLFLAGVLLALFGLIFSISASKTLAIVAGGLLFFVTVTKPFLINRDIVTYDCTELQSMIFTANGLWVPPGKSRNEYPDGMKQVLDNLRINGNAEIVYEKYRYSEPTGFVPVLAGV